jgi:hypothetical protein
MIPVSGEIWTEARRGLGMTRSSTLTLEEHNESLQRGCSCILCDSVRQTVRERYTFDKPDPQFGITLALAEGWKRKQHLGYPGDKRNGKYNVTSCAICRFIVSRGAARKLGLPLPQWQPLEVDTVKV